MEINQLPPSFRPITIKLVKGVEAKAFFNLIDKLKRHWDEVDEVELELNTDDCFIINFLSDAVTNGDITIS